MVKPKPFLHPMSERKIQHNSATLYVFLPCLMGKNISNGNVVKEMAYD